MLVGAADRELRRALAQSAVADPGANTASISHNEQVGPSTSATPVARSYQRVIRDLMTSGRRPLPGSGSFHFSASARSFHKTTLKGR
jgi:hypothetical protein